jgi:hypothetical protein
MRDTWRKFLHSLSSEYWLILLVVIALAGVWMLRSATPYGLGLRNDSVQYIFGARNLLAGNGYMRTSGGGELKPITTEPPLFSAAIALVSLTGLDPMYTARLLILFLFGLDIILLGILVLRISGSRVFALIGATLFATSTAILDSFAWLMTEPLFTLFWLLCFLIYDLYIRSGQKRWLIMLGGLCGLAYLTRYIGVTLLGTFGLLLLLFESGWKAKFTALLSLLLPGLSALVGWSLRNIMISGNPFNKLLLVHIITSEQIQNAINNFWNWFLPGIMESFYDTHPLPFQVIFYLIALVFLAGLVYSIVRNSRRAMRGTLLHQKAPTWMALALFVVIYLALILFTVSFLDARLEFTQRLLIPLFLAVWIMLLTAVYRLFVSKRYLWKIAVVLLLVISLGTSIQDGIAQVKSLKNSSGLGYDNVGFRQSPTIQYIQKLPPIIIYSNRAYGIYIATDRLAYMVVGPVNSETWQPNDPESEEIIRMREAVKAEEAILVYFKYDGYQMDPWFIAVTRGISPIEEFSDAIIFKGVD